MDLDWVLGEIGTTPCMVLVVGVTCLPLVLLLEGLLRKCTVRMKQAAPETLPNRFVRLL